MQAVAQARHSGHNSSHSMQLEGKHVLLISHRPTELMQELAHSLSTKGTHVTLALRHTQDGRYLVKRLQSHGTSAHLQPSLSSQNQADHANAAVTSANLAGPASPGLTSSSTPLNMARLASIHEFAQAVNSSTEPLDLLLIDTWDLYAAGSKDRRWYTPQGVAGTAQTAFIGPAVLLHLLQPKLATSGTAVLLTASPSHRLAALGDLQSTLSSWSGSSLAATQAAVLSYTRRLALQLQHKGVRVAAVDLGLLSERPLKGSLLRKLPVLRQALHILLPSAHDAARLITGVATHMLSSQTGADLSTMPSLSEGMASGTAQQGSAEHAATAQTGASAAAAAATTSGQTRWDPQHIDKPMIELPPGTNMQPTATAAGAEQSVEAHKSADVPHVGPDTDQSAAFDMGKQFSFDQSAKTALGSGQLSASNMEPWGPSGDSLGDVGSKTVETLRAAAGTAAAGGAAAAAALETGVNSLTELAGVSMGSKPFSYISRGLLANPLVTALDHAGSSTWTSRTLHTLAAPLYDLASRSLITAASLADWPVRALLLAPAGVLPSLVSALGPVGAWATQLVSQLQVLMPGVVGVPADAPPAWVEVSPSGAVLDDKLGWRLWHLVQGYAEMQA